jgi:OmpA-OmpF porin, OOP family
MTSAIVEDRSVIAVREVLTDDGLTWASVVGDGLQVILEGRAPSEAIRFRAMSLAGSVVDASRVIDNLSVVEAAGVAPPDFAIEILRNDSGVSLIGLIPASADRDALTAAIARIAGGQTVTDLLETADYPVPATWDPALTYALDALERLPRAKISVRAGRVNIEAISDSLADQRRLESELARAAPPEVRLGLQVSAPRPVITPFTVRFRIDGNGARFDACAADTEEARSMILTAATAAGATGQISCTLALGVPTTSWGEAVAAGITALQDLGGGTLTFSDADISLVAAEGTPQATFDRVIGGLANRLPDIFALDAVLPATPDAAAAGPPEFLATLSAEGAADLSGRVPDDLINITAENFAKARFGAGNVTMTTRIAPDGLPPGWSVRVLAGIEALAYLHDGQVTVQPDTVQITGQTGSPTAQDDIARLLIERLGEDTDFDMAVSYVAALDPIAGLPTAQECVAQITAVAARTKITFDPGSATISRGGLDVLDDIADILRRCAELRLQITGYTDSEGGEDGNLRLSQARAEAVLDGLRARRVPVSGFTALGRGEADPIADNATEAGREANRRIAFDLIADPDATPVDPNAPPPANGSTYTGPAPDTPDNLRLPAPARPDGLGN